ncbi:MAG: hypothetical protein ABFD44_09425 [Anaerolineaceae bacterium]
MLRKAITQPKAIIPILLLQFVPLLLMPAASYSMSTQEWWLPMLLAILALWGSLSIIIRGNSNSGPWYMIGFAQGFNIISRLMLLFPHATHIVNNASVFNTQYVTMSVVSMIISALLLVYIEYPEVRINMIKEGK